MGNLPEIKSILSYLILSYLIHVSLLFQSVHAWVPAVGGARIGVRPPCKTKMEVFLLLFLHVGAFLLRFSPFDHVGAFCYFFFYVGDLIRLAHPPTLHKFLQAPMCTCLLTV